jgi:hypothetical protein
LLHIGYNRTAAGFLGVFDWFGIRFCRDEWCPDRDSLLGHIRRVVDPSNGLKPGWRGA